MTAELRRVTREVAALVEKGGPDDAVALCKKLIDAGAVRDVNVGRKGMKDGSDECIAWYAGQFLNIVETESWFAMNSWLNSVDRFCPEVPS